MRIHANILIGFIITVFAGAACTHEPTNPSTGVPTKSFLTITAACPTCSPVPVCPVVDDIPVQSNTSYSICNPSPAGQGSIEINAQNCILWRPNGQSSTVETCIIACTAGVCDTTVITILPYIPVDTSGNGTPCDPEVIYFDRDILPILTASCAFSGCHNAGSAQDGIILDSYQNVMRTGKIRPGRPNDSDLFEVITESDPDDVMPPPPAPRLSAADIKKISDWIAQGAQNLECDESPNDCVTTNVSFSGFVKPSLNSCRTCHGATNPSAGIRLETYEDIKTVALSGKLHGAINWSPGFKPMPQGGGKLPDCTIKKIKGWIDAGAPNN